jgi:hypothetical protein
MVGIPASVLRICTHGAKYSSIFVCTEKQSSMRALLSLALFFFVTQGFGQSRYSYVEDLKFFDPTDFFGYLFQPSIREVPRVSKDEIRPGSYTFGITSNNLYLKYRDDKILFNIQSIQPTEYGYLFQLLNASNTRETGHLKVILDGLKQARALVLKKTTLGKEEIFHLPEMDDYIKEKEELYYTDLLELELLTPDSIWNKEIYPSFMDDFSVPVRTPVFIWDSTYFEFYEDIVIEEKKKNREDSIPVVDLETFDYKSCTPDSLEKLLDYIKIDHKKFCVFHYSVMQENGDFEMNHEVHIIDKIKEKEDDGVSGLNERFLWEISLEKGDPIFLYLTEYRTVSSIEYKNRFYSVRHVP